MFCHECGASLRETREPMREPYRGEEFVIEGVCHYQCDECGEYMIDGENANELSRRLHEEYARRHGLLSPAQIRAIRTALGVSQKQFEAMLGVSSPTVSRWETGYMQQTLVADNLIRLVGQVPGAADLLMRRANVTPRKTPVIDFPAAEPAQEA